MPYVLMYQARSKQRWYWTIDQKFTSKNQATFLAAFQASRLERRKVKDLSIFLTALAESFDVKKFLNILQSNPSYGNSYSFKDKETADKINSLIRK